MSKKEFANCFMCSPTYILGVENNVKKISLKILEFGLCKLNIIVSGYFELEELRYDLMNRNVSRLLIYGCMLAKSIGLVDPKLKHKTEEVINLTLKSKTR